MLVSREDFAAFPAHSLILAGNTLSRSLLCICVLSFPLHVLAIAHTACPSLSSVQAELIYFFSLMFYLSDLDKDVVLVVEIAFDTFHVFLGVIFNESSLHTVLDHLDVHCVV